jgi:TnpA family transposase
VNSKSLGRLYRKIFELTEYQRYKPKFHEAGLVEHLYKQAQSWAYPRALFDSAVEYLSVRRIAIPAYSSLQDLISKSLVQNTNNLHEKMGLSCSEGLHELLEGLCFGKGPFTLNDLRQGARNFKHSQLQHELAAYKHLYPWFDEIKKLIEDLEISQINQQYYTDRVDYYGSRLKRRLPASQKLYILCYLMSRYQVCLERITDGLIYHAQQARKRAKQAAKEHFYQEWQSAANNISKVADVLRLFIGEDIDPKASFQSVQKRAFKFLDANEIKSVCRYLGSQGQSTDDGFWLQLDSESNLRTGLMRSLFSCVRFEGSEKSQRLSNVLFRAQQSITETGELSAGCVDRRLIPKKVLPFIVQDDDLVNMGRYEWFLYLRIINRLNGQLMVPDVVKYRSLADDLLRRESWKKQKRTLILDTQQPRLQDDPNDIIPSMVQELEDRFVEVSNYLHQSDNQNVILHPASGKYHWRLATSSKAQTVNNPFFQQMRKIDLVDVLRVVDRDTGFIDNFEHVLGFSSKSIRYETDLFAILIANGTNQGINGMSQISDRSYDQLSNIQANYIRPKTLRDANDCINNATTKLPIFKSYNIHENSVHASIDGQKFKSKRETFRTRYSSKYFGTGKGLSAVSLNINHFSSSCRVVGFNEHESHYIFDLLMNNSTDIVPDILSTDTHGVNHANFALLDLFGYRFAPRYAKFSKVINSMFNVTEDADGRIQLSLKKPIRTNLIVNQWDTIQWIGTSLAQRKTDQATLVRKLSGYKSNHPLLEALTEYDRLLKAHYLLDYIDDESLRNHVQRALNRGEAYHQLRRAISAVNGDRFRGNSDEEIQLWNECARLLTNAIIYFNSKVLSHLLVNFLRQGKTRLVDIIKGSSPVAWENINLRGTYTFVKSDMLPDIEQLMATIDEYLPDPEE